MVGGAHSLLLWVQTPAHQTPPMDHPSRVVVGSGVWCGGGCGHTGHMSSDNYILIRRVGRRWAVSNESASSENDRDPETDPVGYAVANLHATSAVDSPWVETYDSEEEAFAAASGEYSEYGVSGPDGVDHVHDTAAARRDAVRAALASDERYGGVAMIENNRDSGTGVVRSRTLHLEGGARITIEGGDDVVSNLVQWVSANLP